MLIDLIPDSAVEPIDRRVPGRPVDARVVVEHIEAAERFHRRPHRVLDRGPVAHVSVDGDRLCSPPPKFGCQPLELGKAKVGEGSYPRALRREVAGDRLPPALERNSTVRPVDNRIGTP